MLNDVSFNLGQGGLGRPLPGSDFISTILFYTANGSLPSGFGSATTADRVKKIYSIEDAEALGVSDTYSDETKATGTYTVTSIGANEDTIEIKVMEPKGSVSLGLVKKDATHTTVTLLADAIVAKINSGTLTHGYTASNVAGLITIVARPGLGIFLNTGSPLSAVIVGTIAGTIVQFSGGVASLQAVWHYHIAEFFRMQPKGVVYLAFYPVPATYDFTDLVTIQQYANGEIKQGLAFCDGTTYSSGKVQAAQTICNTLAGLHMNFSSLLLAFDYSAATLSTLASLSGLNSKNVSIVIGQDGDALGYSLYKATGKSVTNIGAVLGCETLAKVSDDIAWVGKFNISDGTENNVPAFANGVLYSSISKSLADTLDSQRYIFQSQKLVISGPY